MSSELEKSSYWDEIWSFFSEEKEKGYGKLSGVSRSEEGVLNFYTGNKIAILNGHYAVISWEPRADLNVQYSLHIRDPFVDV